MATGEGAHGLTSAPDTCPQGAHGLSVWGLHVPTNGEAEAKEEKSWHSQGTATPCTPSRASQSPP